MYTIHEAGLTFKSNQMCAIFCAYYDKRAKTANN